MKFNEITGKCRSDGELKLAWKRMKLSAKSNVCTYRRRERSKTGGGEKPLSPTPEDLQIMAIAPHDFVIEVNDYDSDAVNPVTAATTTKEMFADPKPCLSFNKNDTPVVINIEYPELNVEVQEISNDPTTDTEMKITNNETANTRGITKTKDRKRGLRNRREDIQQTIIKSNTDFKKRQLEMMEEEHKYNIKIAKLKN
ncbi:unnamed protein product [Parnassius apollo]|uniref:(apollo) hypothetical protein n=2 Tax=Parnassius apollo TaxID=110799 RepID=A0A8S3Y2Q9_PARAO|nr:unnamed protein product [Parnassius apollo]